MRPGTTPLSCAVAGFSATAPIDPPTWAKLIGRLSKVVLT